MKRIHLAALIIGAAAGLVIGIALNGIDSRIASWFFGLYPPLFGGLLWRLSGARLAVAASWSVPLAVVVAASLWFLPTIADVVGLAAWGLAALMTFVPGVGRWWTRNILRGASDPWDSP